MNPKIFFEYSQRTGEFRCPTTGNPCGTDTVMIGMECPSGRTACQWREAFEAGWEARRALGDPPEIEFTIECGLCHNTGRLDGLPCLCGQHTS